MKTTHHTPEQIIKIIEQAEKGAQTIAAVCREHGIAENTFYRWRKTYDGARPMRQQQIDLIVAALCPFADFIPTWSDNIELDTKRWLALTDEQRQILGDIGTRQRLVIDGRSGTGKTVIASVYARDLTTAGRKVLFVLYNRLIRERLDRELRPVGVEVVTFHSLCARAAFRLGWSADDTQAWYLAEGSAALEDALRYGLLEPKDVLILDEAQALRPNWITSLTEWFSNRPILACCDETQVFAFEQPTSSAELATLIGASSPYPLTQSLRSPRAVFDRLRQTLPLPTHPWTTPRPPQKGELEEHIVTEPLKMLQQILRELRNESVSVEAIAVIHTDEKPIYEPDVASVAGITVPATQFRGMEAPVVIVYDRAAGCRPRFGPATATTTSATTHQRTPSSHQSCSRSVPLKRGLNAYFPAILTDTCIKSGNSRLPCVRLYIQAVTIAKLRTLVAHGRPFCQSYSSPKSGRCQIACSTPSSRLPARMCAQPSGVGAQTHARPAPHPGQSAG